MGLGALGRAIALVAAYRHQKQWPKGRAPRAYAARADNYDRAFDAVGGWQAYNDAAVRMGRPESTYQCSACPASVTLAISPAAFGWYHYRHTAEVYCPTCRAARKRKARADKAAATRAKNQAKRETDRLIAETGVEVYSLTNWQEPS
jgi:hypothetical protein